MNHIPIPTKVPEVFDDPEFCSNATILAQRDICPNSVLSLCRAFVNKDQDPTPREFDKSENRFRKCNQCKEAYNRKAPYIDPIKWFPKTMKSAEEFLKNITHDMDEKERKAFIFGWQSSIRFQEDK